MADKRFASLSTDPKYRLPSRKQAQTAVDPRFKTLFTDQGFQKKASVDRYGRKVKSDSGKNDLEKKFRLEEDEEPQVQATSRKGAREVVGSSEESEGDSEDEDDGEGANLVDRARQGGFSESESESEEEETSDEEASDDEVELADETAGHEQTEAVPMGEVSRRIAAVNLDWDNIRATDIMAVANSFVPPGGKLENVTVYPSEFGRERLEREELEGPPREIFASSKRKEESSEEEEEDEDSEDEAERIKKQLLAEQTEDGEEFDTAKLRQYQLDRLRYYYAVISCDGPETAKALYDAMDGREYLTTANFFDLRFIPDETSFDDDRPRDECTSVPNSYKPNDFRTEALTHSKVRLTWDDDDTTRKEVQKRAFSRAEMDENDLQAYIGSDSSDADSVSSRRSAAEDRRAKKRSAERAKMRTALGLGDAPAKSSGKGKAESVGDMQITFSAGLTANGGKDKNGEKAGVFENEPQDEESTRARYVRKERERKQARKDRAKAARAGAGDEAPTTIENVVAPVAADEEDPFNDPFFNDPFFNDPVTAAKNEKAARKAAKAAKYAEREAVDSAAASRRAELELLMAEDDANGDKVRHFDMREIEKAEKAARRKGKGKGKKAKKVDVDGDGEEGEKFRVEAEDPRFKALFESHEFAIDPTNPKFKGTEGMKTLLEEGRKKRKHVGEDDGEGKREKKSKSGKKGEAATGGDEEVRGLVARLKKGKGQ